MVPRRGSLMAERFESSLLSGFSSVFSAVAGSSPRRGITFRVTVFKSFPVASSGAPSTLSERGSMLLSMMS
jgi:hypothetical protein